MSCRTSRLTVVMVLLAAAGCGDASGNVSGRVSFNGSPLPSGKVTFLCEGGSKPVFTANIRDGRYEIKGVPVGAVKITVATYKPSQPVARPPGFGPTSRPDSEAAPKEPEQYVEIPPRYGLADGSNLTYSVKPGEQEFDIPLTP